MNIKKLVFGALVIGTSTYLTGCSIGSSESECPGIEKGVICKGPREVMELTNNRVDLFAGGEDDLGKGKTAVNDSRYPAEISPPGKVRTNNNENLVSSIGPRPISGAAVNSTVMMDNRTNMTPSSGNPFGHSTPATRYVQPNSDISRGKDMYSSYNGQPVNPTLSSGQVQQYRSQGYKQAVVAPEPLAVLQQGKVMRITFAPYTDDNDALNLPGYVYVNVKPQTWIAGKNSTSNPARIVPLEVQDAARDNMQQQQRAAKAVSSNGIVRQL